MTTTVQAPRRQLGCGCTKDHLIVYGSPVIGAALGFLAGKGVSLLLGVGAVTAMKITMMATGIFYAFGLFISISWYFVWLFFGGSANHTPPPATTRI